MITQSDVRRRVKHIEGIADDDEAAHVEEDELYLEVLRAIVDGHPDGVKLATLALETQRMRFARWCA